MRVRILDLDESVARQDRLVAGCRPEILDLRSWGPGLRLGCSFGRFRAFERLVDACLPPPDSPPALTFVGSGDFHHVSLALIRRLQRPFVLLIFDNHPDWMRGVPFLHCGTWVHHA